jgi:GGDEF domain-containing protein
MKRSVSIAGLSLIQLTLVVWLAMLVPVGVVWLVLAIMALLYGLFLLLSPLRSFALLVAIILVHAFVAVAKGWNLGWDVVTQFQSIVLQLVVLGIAAASWAQATELRKWARAYEEAQRQVVALRKMDEAVSVLSANEFKDRLKAILVSLRRRKEPGVVIVVSIPSRVIGFGGRRYTPEAVLQLVGETALAVVRDQFDIVGRISPSTIAIVLQRCDQAGAQRALQRFRLLLIQQRRLRADVVMSWVRVVELPVFQGWSAVEALLEECGENKEVSVRRGGG